ncbi:MAG: transposase [Chitinophagales bacterium]
MDKHKYDPNKHHRRSIRLKDYDYSQEGLYFITICVKNWNHLFGYIEDGVMFLNDAGKLVEREWLKIPNRFQNTRLHEYVVMPNHFHSILEIVDVDNVGASLVDAQKTDIEKSKTGGIVQDSDQLQNNGLNIENIGQPQGIAPTIEPTTKKTIGDMIGAFQSIVTVEYIRGVKNCGWQRFDKKLWQRNYWEHIIRNEKAYQNISNYIINNPQKWENDRFNT